MVNFLSCVWCRDNTFSSSYPILFSLASDQRQRWQICGILLLLGWVRCGEVWIPLFSKLFNVSKLDVMGSLIARIIKQKVNLQGGLQTELEYNKKWGLFSETVYEFKDQQLSKILFLGGCFGDWILLLIERQIGARIRWTLGHHHFTLWGCLGDSLFGE